MSRLIIRKLLVPRFSTKSFTVLSTASRHCSSYKSEVSLDNLYPDAKKTVAIEDVIDVKSPKFSR